MIRAILALTLGYDPRAIVRGALDVRSGILPA